MKNETEIQNRLKYDRGKLYWVKDNGTNIKAGQLAGTIGGHGYRYINIDNQKYLEHRLVWLYHKGVWPKNQIDHIDGDRTNNRIENLRETDQSGNNKNQSLRKDNRVGYRGVSWYKQTKRWIVKIGDKNNRHHLGYFDDLHEAISMRLTAEEHYGYDIEQRVAV